MLEIECKQSIGLSFQEPPTPHMTLLLSILLSLSPYPFAANFFIPIDLTKWPTYTQVIKRPINLGSIGHDVLLSVYGKEFTDAGVQLFIDDVRLVWENCRVFNIEGSMIVQMADFLSDVFEVEMSTLLRRRNYHFDPKFLYATSKIDQKRDERPIRHVLRTCEGDIAALEIMSDMFHYLSDSDFLLGTGLHTLDVMSTICVITEEITTEPVNENEAFAKRRDDATVIDMSDHQVDAGVLSSIDLLSHLVSALRSKAHKIMDLRIQEHPNPAIFLALNEPATRDQLISTPQEEELSSVSSAFVCHIQNYKKHLVDDARLSFLFSKFKNMMLVTIVRDILCGDDTKDLKLKKKFSLVFPKSRLFSLSGETALDLFPGILKIISIERDIASRSSLESFCNTRRPRAPRAPRGTVLDWCKPYLGSYPYLSRIFPDLPEALFEMLATDFGTMEYRTI